MFLTEEMCDICNAAFGTEAGIPSTLVNIVGLIYKAIQIGVPIILIIIGMFDMGKAITQQKEDEIKKAQTLLVKKAVAALIVFLMFAFAQLIVSLVADDKDTTISCIDSILNGKVTDQNENNQNKNNQNKNNQNKNKNIEDQEK